ncbi:PAS domain-containing protein [Ideonella sp. DXS29W]|uniref:histidine kinase n=1 Tax=Ideonella lacteola TaxID=2984193 RepID=A0ABU9BUB5_9BURK
MSTSHSSPDGRHGEPEHPPFLRGGGQMGNLIRRHDWTSTPLGDFSQWPAALRTSLRILLTTNHPVFIFWGPQLICFYNDAYSRSLGPEKHPVMLGEPAQRHWQEIWPTIGPQIEHVMSGGGATWHENQLVPIIRNGALQQVYWTYSYGPIDDDSAPHSVGGVLVLCTETTRHVQQAERIEAQERRWRELFNMAPGFICVLKGPEHRYEYVNVRYMEVAAQRAVIGRTVRECLPELAAQGFVAVLDGVYASGEAYTARAARVALRDETGIERTCYLSFVYQPIRDESGSVIGIFVEGHDVTEEARATAALTDTLASITDGFVALDEDWRFVFVNPEAERLLGQSGSDLLGRTHWHVFPGMSGSVLESHFRHAASGEFRAFDFFYDHWQRWFEVRCYPRRGGGVALYFQDVTSRRQAEALRSEAEQRERERAEELEALMESVPAFIWITHDPRCEHVTGNLNSYRLLGMDPGANATATPGGVDAPRRHFREYIDGRPADPQDLSLQRAARTGRATVPGAVTMVFDDGSRRHLWGGAAPLHDRVGNVRGAVAAFVDVTELRDAQRLLEIRELQLQTITDNSPDILARFDRERRHVYVNQAIERVTGRRRDEFIGRTSEELGLPALQVLEWNSALDRVFQTGQAERLEFSMEGPDGHRRSYVSRLIPEPALDGEVPHVVAIVQDVTEQREAERAIRDAERRKDEFIATLAHELRNPLAPLRTSLHILERSDDPKTLARVLAMMQRQLTHMVRLVDDLMDVSRISAGKMVLQRTMLKLQSVIDAVLESSRPSIESAKHRLEVSLDPDPLMVEGDAARLAQVLGNLLHNAVKYTPDGGRIVLRAWREGDTVLVAVKDDGIGIPPERQVDVFRMFTQMNTSLDRSQGGLGIGLALARNIVELHGGTIAVASQGLGRGSEFTVRLPSALGVTGSPTPTPAAAAAQPVGASALRLMLIDDNRDAADSFAVLLRLGGHEVRVAYDGLEGLAIVQQWRPHVVFADIGMPGMNGHEIARRLRAWDPEHRLLLVAVTGWGTEKDQNESRAAGFDRHMTKPVDLGQIEEVLSAVAALATEHGSAGPAEDGRGALPSG